MEDPKKVKMLSMEAIPHFEEGISLVLSNWWALQMAIENGWGGPNTRVLAQEFSSDILDIFNSSHRHEPLDIYELEDFLDERMSRLNTDVEDGSIEEVAEKLMVMYEDCLEGDYQSIQRLKHVKAPSVTHVKQEASDSDGEEDHGDETMENDEGSNMMVDSPESLLDAHSTQAQQNGSKHQEVVEAEDGWTVVPPRKNSGRRN